MNSYLFIAYSLFVFQSWCSNCPQLELLESFPNIFLHVPIIFHRHFRTLAQQSISDSSLTSCAQNMKTSCTGKTVCTGSLSSFCQDNITEKKIQFLVHLGSQAYVADRTRKYMSLYSLFTYLYVCTL